MASYGLSPILGCMEAAWFQSAADVTLSAMLCLTQSRTFRTKQAIELLVLLAFWSLPQPLIAQATPAAETHEQRANAFLAQKKPGLAIPEFRAVLAADPNNLNAQANLGVLLFFQQDYAGAIPYLRQAIVQKPVLAKIRSLLGLAEMYLGQTKEARADLEVAVPEVGDTPIRIQAGLALIEIDVASQDLDKAAAVVAFLREGTPTDPRVLYAAYRIATQQAGEAMLSLSLVAPDSAQMREAMAQELERGLNTSGAITNLRKAAELDPTLPGIHYELARVLHEANDEKLRAEAESEYRMAIEQNPRDARSAAALGNLANDRGDAEAAARFYTQSFAIDPQLPDAAIALADLDAAKGNYAAAATKLEGVVETDSSNILAHYRLFTAYRKLGRQDDAKRELEAFEHYKDLKDKMRAIYLEMRQRIPGEEEPKTKK